MEELAQLKELFGFDSLKSAPEQRDAQPMPAESETDKAERLELLMEGEPQFFPKAEVFPLHHGGDVSCVALHPSQNRYLSGNLQGDLCMWEQGALNSKGEAFRTFEPFGGHPVESIAYNAHGQVFIVASGDPVVRIFDGARGEHVQETVKGDMYIRDISHTDGHTHSVTQVQWHPFDRVKFASAGMDCSVRLFDTDSKLVGIDQTLPSIHVLKGVDQRNMNISRVQFHSVCHSHATGKTIIGGASDGSVQLWRERRKYGKPDKVLRGFHDSPVGQVVCASDDWRVFTRETAGPVKLFDLRKLTQPVLEWNWLQSSSRKVPLCLSPWHDQEVMMVTHESEEGVADIVALDTSKVCDPLGRMHTSTRVNDIVWSALSNQLLAACANGSVQNYYDKEKSVDGALVYAEKAPRLQPDLDSIGRMDPVFAPNDPSSLPTGYFELYDGQIKNLRHRDQIQARQKTTVLEKPLDDQVAYPRKGVGLTDPGREPAELGVGVKDNDSAAVLRNVAQRTGSNYFMRMYDRTQPNRQLDTRTNDDSLQASLLNQNQRCPKCGLKMCVCGYMREQKQKRQKLS